MIKILGNDISEIIYRMLYELVCLEMKDISKIRDVYWVETTETKVECVMIFPWGSVYGNPEYTNYLNRIYNGGLWFQNLKQMKYF